MEGVSGAEGRHNSVISDSTVGILVELHHCDTCDKVFSPPCAEQFDCFPCEWHRDLQTQKGLGVSPVIGLCPLRGEKTKRHLLGLFLMGVFVV